MSSISDSRVPTPDAPVESTREQSESSRTTTPSLYEKIQPHPMSTKNLIGRVCCVVALAASLAVIGLCAASILAIAPWLLVAVAVGLIAGSILT